MSDFDTTTAEQATDEIADAAPVTAAPMTDALSALLDAGFDPDAAETAVDVARDQSTTVNQIVSDASRADTYASRVAIFADTIDNSGSMADLLALALQAHNRAVDVVQKVTAGEPVTVLVSCNFFDRVQHGLVPIAEAPRFPEGAERTVNLLGYTSWYDAYAAVLAALSIEMERLEALNKTVFSMPGVLSDGFDTSSETTVESLRKLIIGYRRTETVAPWAMHCGAMPKPGQSGYDGERFGFISQLHRMGDLNPELETLTLEELVRRYYVGIGFDPAMVFLPGQDPRAIVKAFVSVSKLMANVSKGQMPEHLTEV